MSNHWDRARAMTRATLLLGLLVAACGLDSPPVIDDGCTAIARPFMGHVEPGDCKRASPTEWVCAGLHGKMYVYVDENLACTCVTDGDELTCASVFDAGVP